MNFIGIVLVGLSSPHIRKKDRELMKTLSKSEVLEVLKLTTGETSTPQIMHNEIQAQDARAKIAFGLIQHWGAMATFGDIMSQMSDSKPAVPVKPVPPAELVMRVCEVVDAAWSEMRHRGWIFDVEALGD